MAGEIGDGVGGEDGVEQVELFEVDGEGEESQCLLDGGHVVGGWWVVGEGVFCRCEAGGLRGEERDASEDRGE